MSQIFRNPFTPEANVVLSPPELLQRKLDFAIWNVQNPITHRSDCMDAAHHEVMIDGMCCIQHLQQCIEENLLNLASCKAGICIEPEGYQKWLVLAQERLAELQSGQDNLDKWTQLLKEQSDSLHEWIWNHDDGLDYNLRPGFSLNSFVVACQKYGFSPEFKTIALAFGFTEREVSKCWANPTK